MMIGTGERDRYLDVTVPALLEFCDAVVAVDESIDGSGDRAVELGALVERSVPDAFFTHEGRARQLLVDCVLEQQPSHVIMIDADELVTDGASLRVACESVCPVLTLALHEAWAASADGFRVRVDGQWATGSACVWRADYRPAGEWRILDRALACGRDPVAVRILRQQRCWEPSGAEIVHLGWANRAEREARYQRYAVNDGGRFHANSHLQSILWPDTRVGLRARPWPAAWSTELRNAIVERANRA